MSVATPRGPLRKTAACPVNGPWRLVATKYSRRSQSRCASQIAGTWSKAAVLRLPGSFAWFACLVRLPGSLALFACLVHLPCSLALF